jgi:hypothetical protein
LLSRTGKAAVVLALCLSPLPARAQTVAQTFDELRGQLKPGDTVWVTDKSNRESRGRIVDFAESSLVLTTDQGRQEVAAPNIVRLRQRRPDSVVNGALIGAASALVPMIWWFAQATESGETAGENVGFIALMVGTGAGAGTGIDALIQGRKTIYLAPARSSARLRLSPMLLRNVKGVRVSLSF